MAVVVEDIIAGSGERISIRFGADGFAIQTETSAARGMRYLRLLFSGWVALLGLVVWLVAVYLQPWLRQHHGPAGVTTAFDRISVGAFVYLLLWLAVWGGGAAIGEISAYVGLGLLVVILPLRLIPGCRPWVDRRLSGKARVTPDQERRQPGWMPATSVAAVDVSSRGRRTTVTLDYADGAQASYRARGAVGRALAREFRRMIDPPDPAAVGRRPARRFGRPGDRLGRRTHD
jgi:hypothetical protein